MMPGRLRRRWNRERPRARRPFVSRLTLAQLSGPAAGRPVFGPGLRGFACGLVLFVSCGAIYRNKRLTVNKPSETGFYGSLGNVWQRLGPYLIPLHNRSTWATRCARNTRANHRRHGRALISWPPAPGQNPPTRHRIKTPSLDQGANLPGKKTRYQVTAAGPHTTDQGAHAYPTLYTKKPPFLVSHK